LPRNDFGAGSANGESVDGGLEELRLFNVNCRFNSRTSASSCTITAACCSANIVCRSSQPACSARRSACRATREESSSYDRRGSADTTTSLATTIPRPKQRTIRQRSHQSRHLTSYVKGSSCATGTCEADARSSAGVTFMIAREIVDCEVSDDSA
jgi:hypothetical protein